MIDYEIDEAKIQLPQAMVDISANTLEVDLPGGSVCRVYVARRPKEDDPLAVQVERRLADLRRQLPGFESHKESTIVLDGRDAIEARFSYRDGATPLYHRAVAFLAGKKLVMMGVVAPVPATDFADETFDGVLSSLVIEDRDAPH